MINSLSSKCTNPDCNCYFGLDVGFDDKDEVVFDNGINWKCICGTVNTIKVERITLIHKHKEQQEIENKMLKRMAELEANCGNESIGLEEKVVLVNQNDIEKIRKHFEQIEREKNNGK